MMFFQLDSCIKSWHILPPSLFLLVPYGILLFPPRLVFFAWEESWGKVLTLGQFMRRGVTLANRCFLCEEEEESIDHLLIHFPRVKMLWELFLAIVGSSWVFPRTIRQTLLAWQNVNVCRKCKRIWMAAPLCLFWTV